ncbi:glycoside hydrolase family 2 TIM barrel-domain containing protein [Mucilaginibacter sp. CSA2-8R]|uniref:glycoside hydrolase family 2 TIM barrel-domain containing protein n=1 Tax=Mucilaginibacter sp. CSA2-8R TaxID=3141542 RepID=UPI00315CB5FB
MLTVILNKKIISQLICIFVFGLCPQLLFSLNRKATPGRQCIALNQDWYFSKDSSADASLSTISHLAWHKVSLPHTWNDKDVTDDQPGYYRGVGWYRKSFAADQFPRNEKLFLSFNGINQEAEVFINRKLAGKHAGGYTRFVVPIDRFLKAPGKGLNEILVRVTNRFNEDIAPLTADFTFFGGIYREVNLLSTESVHFTLKDDGSDGVYISTPVVDSASAHISVKSLLENNSNVSKVLNVKQVVLDKAGKLVTSYTTTLRLAAGEQKELHQNLKTLTNPRLWSPANPYLYQVFTSITDQQTGETLDRIVNAVGLRWFKFDANTGFYLNGKPLKLMGASRHQDYKDMGNAVPAYLQIKDMEWIKRMGGNFVRIAHYPQDPVVLKACDELGILASVEIPIVNAITESEAFSLNCKHMQVEMIRQNFNHPSIILWGYMNEVLLRPKFTSDKPRQEIYYQHIRELAQELEKLTRKEDPGRYTMMACHGDFDRYNRIGLTKIPQVLGWNLYQGWYSGSTADFGKFLDKHHLDLPDQPVLITEYGADADPRIRSQSPVRFDKSVEYAIKFHQVYLNEILKRPFVSGAAAWNLADFNSETREETMPHINNKGLLTIDRKPKDTYHLYQAYLSKKPFIKIASANWYYRGGINDSLLATCTQPVTVVTNLDAAELFYNGKSLGIKKAQDRAIQWEVPFINGKNNLKAVGIAKQKFTDTVSLLFKNYASQPSNQTGKIFYNILLGANRMFIDEKARILWIPGKAYVAGSWGFLGGKPYSGTNNRILYGSDKDIKQTDMDPVYQTQQVGITAYKFDVPKGNYKLILHFAELLGGPSKEALAYNLDNNHKPEEQEVDRVFDVRVNGQMYLKNFNIAKQYGYATAVKKVIKLKVDNNQGIQIEFLPVKGLPVLNALQLVQQ